MRVWHVGYNARGAAVAIDKLLSEHDNLLLIDTRHVPWSRRPEFVKEALEEKYKDRYKWAGKYLGNLHHKGGPIAIADLATGIRGLRMYLEEGNDLLLMCQCADAEKCHRSVILDALKRAMPEIEIIDPELDAAQSGMLKCISIQQPYSDWIVQREKFVNAGIMPKTIENRDWNTHYRGPLLIHAGKKIDEYGLDSWLLRNHELRDVVSGYPEDYVKGCIVGYAELVDIVTSSNDPWYITGSYGFVLANAQPFEHAIPYRGALGLFDVPLEVVQAELDLIQQKCYTGKA